MASTFPTWIYDPTFEPADPLGHGERAVRFLRLLKHPKSKLPRRAFQLDPWQEKVVRAVFGPRHADGTRIISTVVMVLPRGSRKSSLAAALSLLCSIGPERCPGGEALFAASDRNQASIGFREALSIIHADKRLTAAVKVSDAVNSTKSITYKKDGTRLQTISADGARQHGRTPNFVLVDELHIWKNRDLWEAIQTGLAKSDGSLMVVATTAGRGTENLAHEIVEDARKVARGEVDDPSILPVLFESDPKDDWQDEALWHRVNPGLRHGYPSLSGLRKLAKQAERRPGERDSFRQLHLNQWLDISHSPFVEMDLFDQCAGPIDLDEVRHLPAYIGVDLSSTTDLSSIVICWRTEAGRYLAKSFFFCPGEQLRERSARDGVPYVLWADQGHIEPTPGSAIDYGAIENRVRELCAEFNVVEVAFDPWAARPTIMRLCDEGIPAVEMRQGSVTMGPAVRELERAIVAQELQHEPNPVLRWNFSNVAVEIDRLENKSFTKRKSTGRIDGAMAKAMAVGRAHLGGSALSSYAAGTLAPASSLVI
ncbi:MAG TPA: terminase TerL endonuclease subunit [Mesorhizobium sp.]|jgi:phage terminase large subunit-like protein|nr:terminase TerL endonuclease subunit [Mesorhizobium sp.]